MMQQAMGQAPFYFYNPESKRQHYPQQQMHMYPMVPTLPSTPVYSRPGTASNSQPPTLYSNGPAVMTPTASPQPMSHKPAILLENELYENSYFPSTPPLSTSGSTIGSPSACEVLQTPMNPMFSGLDGMDGFKEGLEPAETAVLDWSSCGSPPMTPVYLQSQVPSLGNTASDLLSTPSLSPSPAPYARSVSTPDLDVDFCDPRNLTVSTGSAVNTTLAPELNLDDIKVEPKPVAPTQSFDFNHAIPQGLPTFEDFSDFETEDEFVNSLVNLGELPTADVTRPRACTGSSVVSLGHGSFIGDEDLSFDDNEAFQFPSHPSPPSPCSSDDCHEVKRLKKTHCCKDNQAGPVMDVAATTTESGNDQESPNQAGDASDSGASSGSEGTPAPLPAPANRRGRKQSLTEDPSKTFVCDLCNRRFRRQEHLKRHYRSLHTQEKPFECNECGKKFSRSDNLAQHARTHGSGAIVMNLIDDDSHAYDASMVGHTTPDDYNNYGKVLFQIASEVPGSASEMSSDEGSDQGKKKRKRSD
ncbi:hypothetical protein F66182_1666 [Fusarium sp. NRRL 66182]|nr:hypothetical protein F66182_1666 [Fusarium sp. NRRL 66182]